MVNHTSRTWLILLILAAATGVFAAAAPRPNIVLIMADDMGFADLGCYGGEIHTPNLDRLAANGVRFTQFYNTAKCETTRATLLSGLYNDEVGGGALRNCIPIGHAMKQAGYTTLMTGKWHLSGDPIKHGFDRYFGHLSGATNFFWGDDTFRLDQEKFDVPREGFYTTDANTNYAMQFLDWSRRNAADKPFFLYIAYNAPHYPLHALPEDIAKYKGKYLQGWDKLREERHARQLKMGLLPEKWKLSPRDPDAQAWDALSEAEKQREDLVFATYAAMIDRLDQNIGRLMTKLQEMGVAENTLVMFLSDNGGCPFERTKDKSIPPGGPESYWTYHTAWAQASNTPLRLYKQNQHEGGISSPFIAHWPAGIKQPGAITTQPGHLVDIMATCLDLAGGEYPSSFDGQAVRPLRGKPLTPIFQGGRREPHESLYFRFSNNRALREGDWKAVAARGGEWELYNLADDRTELNDLAARHPDRVQAMAERWEALNRDLMQAGGEGKGGGGGKQNRNKKQKESN